MNQDIYDVLVIGSGVTGSLIARELSKYQLTVGVIEKCNDVGNATSNANSAIVHSGYDPLPGTNKAKFNVLGNPMFDELCDDLDIEFSRIGSLTVASMPSQVALLSELAKRSAENGVEVKILTGEEVSKLEPNIKNSYGALLAPTAGIINPFELTIHAMENAVDNGVKLHLSQKVVGIEHKNDVFYVKTERDLFKSKILINASGNYADKIAEMLHPIDWSITSRKGEYFVLDHSTYGLVNHVIFPLPSEKGKGVLVAPTTGENIIVGPSSEPIEGRDDVSTDTLTLNNIKAQANLIVSNIPYKYIIRTFAGLRPTCSRHDFIIEKDKEIPCFINVSGIESPGLASSPAIAKYVVEELVGSLCKLTNKVSFNPKVRKYPRIKKMDKKERELFISSHPEFGEIVCNCEQISLGEMKDVLSRNVAPTSIKGMKRRVRAGFGRCQGGFCQPKVLLLLAKHYDVSPLDIPLDDTNSNIVLRKIKEVN